MTIAIDRVSGAVVGQVCNQLPWSNYPEPENSGRVLLLTRDGYISAQRDSVRLEVLR